MRPRGKAKGEPRHFVTGNGWSRDRRPNKDGVSAKPGPSLRACGARPSAWGPVQGKLALWGKAPRLGGRGFSRRGALCAPAWQGRTQTEAFH